MTTRDIGALFDVSSACVSYWVSRKTTLPSVTRVVPPPVTRKAAAALRKRRSLVARIVAETVKQFDKQNNLLREVPKNGSSSAVQRVLARDHNIRVCKKTVVLDLHAQKFISRVRPRVPDTGVLDAALRLAFARILLRYPLSYLRRIAFSDEKLFTSNDETWRRQWVQPGERPLRRESKRFPKGRVMAWAVIGYNYKVLVLFPDYSNEVDDNGNPKKFRVTSRQYINRCLAPIAKDFTSKNLVFQQDNAGAHTASVQYMNRKGFQLLPSQWPPRSPMLSPIETLWAIMAPRVAAELPQDSTTLRVAIRKVFDEMPMSTINALVLSFKGRLDACVQAHGSA